MSRTGTITMRNGLTATLLTLLATSSFASDSVSEVIEFDGGASGLVSSYSEDGYTVSAVTGMFFISTNAAGGSPPRIDTSVPLEITRDDGQPFSLGSLRVNEGFSGFDTDWRLEGTLAAGGTVVHDFVAPALFFDEIVPVGLVDVLSVKVMPITPNAGGSFDDFAVTGPPLPGAEVLEFDAGPTGSLSSYSEDGYTITAIMGTIVVDPNSSGGSPPSLEAVAAFEITKDDGEQFTLDGFQASEVALGADATWRLQGTSCGGGTVVQDVVVSALTFDEIVPVGFEDVFSVTVTPLTPGAVGEFDDFAVRDGAAICCQLDLGFGGPGDAVLSLCGDDLGAGGVATLALADAAANSMATLVIGLDEAPTPFKGGLLVPLPIFTLVTVPTDGSGAVAFPVDGGIGLVSIYLQAVYPDATLPGNFGFSNAVRADFLP